jgi:hypothetical protein
VRDRPAGRRDTTSRGDLAELAVATALVQSGRRLLRPISSATRYDLVIDNDDGTFTRVQCKMGVLRCGRVEFRTYSISGHRTDRVNYRGQIDAFGVYCLETADAYLVPMEAVARCGAVASLRVLPARNGQSRHVRMALDYVIGPLREAGPSPPRCR